MNRDELREALAAYAHEAWSGWMQHLFRQGNMRGKDRAHIILPHNAERWRRQMNAPYTDLPEEEKSNDRVEADKILAIVDEYLQSPMSKEEKLAAVERATHPLLVVSVGEACEWEFDAGDFSDYWDTSCGEAFQLVDGTLEENSMRFCPFCGRRIKQIEEEKQE